MAYEFRRLPVFANLREEYVRTLEPLLEPYSCEPGTSVIQQSTPAEYLYVILRGAVEVSFKPYDGAPITVSHIEQGGLFGWSAVVGSDKYTSTATAIGNLEAVRIPGNELRKLCADNPEAGREILNCLANAFSSRWKDAHEQVKLLLAHGMKNGKDNPE